MKDELEMNLKWNEVFIFNHGVGRGWKISSSKNEKVALPFTNL